MRPSKAARTFFFVVTSSLALASTTSGQISKNTCGDLVEPRTYQQAIIAAPDPKNDRPAVIFGEPVDVPAFRLRFIDGKSGAPYQSKKVTVNYSWRWLEYPYPEHAWGAWSFTSDSLTCVTDVDGLISTSPHKVTPRGWYNGKYTKFPWSHKPSFTGIEIVMHTGYFARVNLGPNKLQQLSNSLLLVRVFDGWRTEITWEQSSDKN